MRILSYVTSVLLIQIINIGTIISQKNLIPTLWKSLRSVLENLTRLSWWGSWNPSDRASPPCNWAKSIQWIPVQRFRRESAHDRTSYTHATTDLKDSGVAKFWKIMFISDATCFATERWPYTSLICRWAIEIVSVHKNNFQWKFLRACVLVKQTILRCDRRSRKLAADGFGFGAWKCAHCWEIKCDKRAKAWNKAKCAITCWTV